MRKTLNQLGPEFPFPLNETWKKALQIASDSVLHTLQQSSLHTLQQSSSFHVVRLKDFKTESYLESVLLLTLQRGGRGLMKPPEPQALRVVDSERGPRTTALHAAKPVVGNSGSRNRHQRLGGSKNGHLFSRGSGS